MNPYAIDPKAKHQWWHWVAAVKNEVTGDLYGIQATHFCMEHGKVVFSHVALTDVKQGTHHRAEITEDALMGRLLQFKVGGRYVTLYFVAPGGSIQEYPSETSKHFGYPSMEVVGHIDDKKVNGVGCYDRECFDRLLKPGEVGWEWIIAWFDDGTWEMGYAFLAPDGSATRTPLPLSFVYHGQPYGATALVLGLWPQGKFNAPYEESLKEIVTLERKVYPRIGLAFHERVPNIDL